MIIALLFQILFTVAAIKGVDYGTGRHMNMLEHDDIEKALLVCSRLSN
jgi:hypothetical protein